MKTENEQFAMFMGFEKKYLSSFKNKVIAMLRPEGYAVWYSDTLKFPDGKNYAEVLKYDTSLDWLHTVLQKIRSLALNDLDRETWEKADKVLDAGIGNPLEYHVKNALEFVSWYNEKKQ